MNLNLSIDTLCEILDADFIDSSHHSCSKTTIRNVVIDSRSPLINKQTLFIALRGNKTNGIEFVPDFLKKGGCIVLTDTIVPSDGVAQLKVKHTLRALQKLAAYHRSKFKIPVIGITGSNGKTTVKEWLYHVFKGTFNCVRSPKSYNSQIGVALSVLEMDEQHELAIFEAGISRPGEMIHLEKMIQPTTGIFTGIGDAHNKGFNPVNPEAEKKREKFILYDHVNMLIQRIDQEVVLQGQKSVKKLPVETDIRTLKIRTEAETVSAHMPFSDSASMENAALVYATAHFFDLPNALITEKLKTLPAISMRLEKMNGKENNVLINDAYNLDEKSLEIGLQYLQSNREDKKACIFIAEDPNDLSPKTTLLHTLKRIEKQVPVDRVVYFGPEKISRNFDLVTHQYDTVGRFFEAPLEIKDSVILFTGARVCHLETVVHHYAEKKHITQLQVNLGNLRKNLNVYRSKLKPETKILCMVKAQSYGGGMIEVARFLETEQIHYFGVAYADEGVQLRKGGIQTPVLVMNPEPAAFDDIIDYNLEPSIYSLSLLNAFIHQLILRGKRNYPLHIKLDTGMNRLGFRQAGVKELTDMLQAQPEVYIQSVFSHLSVADDLSEEEYTRKQIQTFEKVTAEIEENAGYSFTRHLANSAGTYSYPAAHFNMVRLGIGLFGLLQDSGKEEFHEVLSLKSQISQIRLIEKGESVGYGRSFIAKGCMKIGIVPVGYGDGLRRALGRGKWSVGIQGKTYPIIGNVCMDMCMIDLGTSEISAGEEVLLFGTGNTIFEMSKALDTIPYEIISSISSRVQRVYLED